jgi:hypothetical protein
LWGYLWIIPSKPNVVPRFKIIPPIFLKYARSKQDMNEVTGPKSMSGGPPIAFPIVLPDIKKINPTGFS